MQNLKHILVISMVLNLLLAAGFWSRLNRGARVGRPQTRIAAATPAETRISTRTTTNTVVVSPAAKLLDWRTVESADYRGYIANLRSVGCPEKTIRDIIVADVNELYRQRFLSAFPPTNRIEYWKPGDPLANLIDEPQVARLQEFAKEKRDLVSDLLGTDYSGELELSSIQTEIFMERLLNFLTPEKRNALKELESKFTARFLNTVKNSVRGDNQGARAALAERDEQILKILSPEEEFEYEVRRSDASMLLRVGLGDTEVTEQEFRDIFPAMKRFIAEAGMPSFLAMVRGDGDSRPETLSARQELLQDLKKGLGQNRFEELMAETGWMLIPE